MRRHPLIVTLILLIPTLLLLFAAALGGTIAANHLSYRAQPLSYGQHETSAIVRVGQTVHLTVTRCNSSKHDVQYLSDAAWVSVVPSGIVITSPRIAVVAQPGCVTKSADRVMPQDVIDQTNTLLGRGFSSVTWRISFVSTPEGRFSVSSASWTTDSIVVIP